MDRLKKALEILRAGGIVAHATETCYGFACDIFNQRALARLYQIKKMPHRKPVSIMVSNLAMAKKYGVFNTMAQKPAKKYWPGPLTIIVKRKKSLPSFLNPSTKTVGIRCPGHKLSRELVKKFGSPLTTTSANISGQPSPYSVSAIKKQFQQAEPQRGYFINAPTSRRGNLNRKFQPDLILNSGQLKKNPPSTIIDVSQKTPKIIRQGDVIV